MISCLVFMQGVNKFYARGTSAWALVTYNYFFNVQGYTVSEQKVTGAHPGGGHSTFFQVGVCGPDFRSVGLAN